MRRTACVAAADRVLSCADTGLCGAAELVGNRPNFVAATLGRGLTAAPTSAPATSLGTFGDQPEATEEGLPRGVDMRMELSKLHADLGARIIYVLTIRSAMAGAAATAETDLDIRRNGVSFAKMRFAAGVTTASFLAASETVLEPGDVVSVVAPETADPTLADIGFTLAGALLL